MTTLSTKRVRRSAGAALAAAILFLASCSGGEEDATEVATLQADDPALEDAADAATREDAENSNQDLSPDEAALQFSQCMRDEGLDFPDLSVDADGNIELREAFQTVDRNAEGFREAREACGEFLAQAGFGGGGRGQALEDTDVQDALLEFSECVRQAGYDVGDLTLERGGPCLLYTSPSPRDATLSRMPSSA